LALSTSVALAGGCRTTCKFICEDRVLHQGGDQGHSVCTTICPVPVGGGGSTGGNGGNVPHCPNDRWIVDAHGVVHCAG